MRVALPLRRLLGPVGLAVGLAVGLPFTSSARAGDEPAPAASAPSVDRLTSDELATLRRRFPDWDNLEAGARERVAASVVRLRGLSPEDRARVLGRAKRLDRAGPVASEAFARRLGHWSRFGPDDRRRFLQADLAAQALALAMFEALGPDARAALETILSAETSPGGRHTLGAALGKAWRQRATATLAATPPLDHEPSEALPAPKAQALRDLRERVRAQGGAAAPEELRQRYALFVLEDRLAGARARAAAGAQAPERERLLGWGRALRDLDPTAFAAVTADLAQAVGGGAEGLERLRERHQPGRAAVRERGLWDLVRQLELRRRELPPELVAQADALEAGLLAALGVPPARAALLLGEKHPGRRWVLLLETLREGGVPVGVGPGRGGGHGRSR